MKETGKNFISIAEKYGFKIQKSWDKTISLMAENTDGKSIPWISYNTFTDDISISGNTDKLNLWLYDTRPDLGPYDIVNFVKELNQCFELEGFEKLRVDSLIDPEDWQGIAGVRDAMLDPLFNEDLKGEIIMSDKHIIWSNRDLDVDDWRDGYAEFLEINGLDLDPDDDDAVYDYMIETNNNYLDDERANLDIQLSQSILVVADLGLWNGHFSGYKEIEGGNIRDCLYTDTDYTTWFVDKEGDLCCDATHHDGTNHYLYRVYKDDVTDEQIEDLKEKIYDGVATREDIEAVTDRLGDEIGKVYGWEFPAVKEVKSIEACIEKAEKEKTSFVRDTSEKSNELSL